MKQILLAVLLISAPVGAFSAFHIYFRSSPSGASSVSLGDLSAFRTIVAEAQSIASGGDLVAAEKRMTDFETAWDTAQSELRALNSSLWGNIDDAHDVALHALRAGKPVATEVKAGLDALAAVLDDPAKGSGTAAGGVQTLIAGVAITDANGRALPCEEMLKTLRAEMVTARLADADRVQVDGFLTRGTERCNADDDRRADAFFAQGLALIRKQARVAFRRPS